MFAAPATAEQLSRGIVSSLSTPPRAHGAKTSQATSKTSSGPTASAPSSSTARVTRSGCTSVTTSARACFDSVLGEAEPDVPRPWTATRPAGELVAAGRLEQRGAEAEEAAERGRTARGLPPPPSSTVRPVTCCVVAAHGAEVGDADVDVLGGDVRAVEVRDEAAHRLEELLASCRVGSATTTDLPPPSPVCATADL